MQEFTIEQPQFDKNTYFGRVLTFASATNPKYAFLSKSYINEQIAIIEEQKKRESENFEKTGKKTISMSEEDIYKIREAQNIVQGTCHPDTNLPLPFTMRCTSFMPMNIPITLGFMLAPPTVRNVIGMHWANQSYNAQFNYGNASASSPMTTEEFMKSYAVAVSVAVTVGLTVSRLLKPMSAGATGVRFVVLNSFTAALASAIAGASNNYIMR